MIGSYKLRYHISVKPIALGLAHAKPISHPIHGLGVNRIDGHSMIQKKIHHPPRRLLDRCPKLDPLDSSRVEPAPHLRQPVGSFLNFHLSSLGGLLIAHVHLMHSVSPIHSHVVSLHFPFLLLRFVLPIPIALNGMFALYRFSIRGQLSIEPLAPFSHRPGQSLPDPPGDRIKVVLMPASSLNRCHIKMFSSMTMCNQGNIRKKEGAEKIRPMLYRSRSTWLLYGKITLEPVRDDARQTLVFLVEREVVHVRQQVQFSRLTGTLEHFEGFVV